MALSERHLRWFLAWLRWLIAEKLFPPIESPALPPIRGRRAHSAASIVEDWWEPAYHGDPTEDDKWPDQDTG